MKNTAFSIKNSLFMFVMGMAGVFFMSCGLEEFYVLEEPTVQNHLSYYSTDDYAQWYCDFKTNDTGNKQYSGSSSAFKFLGTGIYYKIYNNTSTLTSHRSAISSVNTSSNYSAAATKMIETYGYQHLSTNPNQNWFPFVESASTNRQVVLRLKSYAPALTSGSLTDYSTRACVKIGDYYIGYDDTGSQVNYYYDSSTNTWYEEDKSTVVSDVNLVIPYRYDGTHSFDFFDDDDDDTTSARDVLPAGDSTSSDDDFYYSSTATSDDRYYVQLYAVAIGRDSNYTVSYSLVLDLGTIPIVKGE